MGEPNPEDYPTFTGEQLVSFREAFQVKDVQNHGYIPYTEFASLWRAVGQNPSNKKVDEIVAEFSKGTDKFFDMDKFFHMCESHHFEDALSKEAVMEAFRTFDHDGSGVLEIKQLRLMLQARGEFQLFSDDEADDFVEFAEKAMKDPRGPKELEPGKIDYEWLVEMMADKDPGIGP
jgi:Ca2+-binding EF-hand superfamily protein